MTESIALLEFLDPEYILNWLGPLALVGVCAIIFAECGLLIGFFLPGDSLLFVTGLFIATPASDGVGRLINTPIWVAMIVLAVMAVLGNLVGYWIGHAVGPKLFDRPNSRLFRQEYVAKTHNFFEKYGGRAIVLARFVPIVRTFITAMAGIGKMDFRVYMTYSAIGGVIWAAGVTLLGYLLGGFSFVKDNIEFMLILIVFLSVLPIIIEFIRHRRASKPVLAK